METRRCCARAGRAPAEPLLVARGDDSGPRLLDLGEAATHLDTEAGDLDRERTALDHALEEIRTRVERYVMHDRRKLEPAPSNLRMRPAPSRQLMHDATRRIDVDLLGGQPEEELEGRVAGGLGHHLAGGLRDGTPGSQLLQVALDVPQALVSRPVERRSTRFWARERSGEKTSAAASVPAAVGSVEPQPIAMPSVSETAAKVAASPAVRAT